ncbi:hypothetical protein OG874_01735 [Nocardia sp. NBC_00565]|uniref:ABC transporter substrate-binding protein n=1 Tax=Nocardia sp. NBC_00565 TaxID=2975993 RepID=UPI002E823BF6|nr:hypothetical protein [Nocardia sp. NBC_00565]WUC03962.1 hypothetical protein OG874_01735 [Nocardia sp. NBC_00565]
MPGSNDIGKLLELLRALYVPHERPRVLRTLVRRRRQLPRPLICLVGPAANGELLTEIYRWLGESGGRRAVPRARVELHSLAPDAIRPDPNATGREVNAHCLPILQRLVAGFSTENTAMGPISFPRYRTADWLTRQRVTSDETEAAVELRARLPKLLRLGSRDSDSMGGEVGDWLTWVVFAVLALWPVLRLWMWISGRVPGLSKETRWFMRQRYMAPELSDSFLGFATRLTASLRNDENEDQVAKLLVHAFLEDLRDAYRQRIWRPSSWRRTAYPVALLGTVAVGSSGADLLRRINDIRNETGIFDPLVVVAALDYDPRDLEPARPVHQLADIGDLHSLDNLESLDDGPASGPVPDPLRQWLRDIDNSRTHRLADAWYLRLALPDPVDGRIGDPNRTHLAVPPAPPLAARKWFVSICVLIPVAALVATALVYVPALRGAPCSHWPWTSGIAVAEHGGECVGYSDNDRQVFADDPELSAMQREVFRQNKIAADIRRDNPRRPLISLVYFAGISYSDSNVRYPHAQVQELAGLAVRQRRAIGAPDESEPLLRIIVANGGTNMRAASWVVDHLLADMLRKDPGVLGVVGMDRSTAETARAIGKLGDLGVPVVATTLSADGLEAASPMFFQSVPSNRVQARLIADYVQGARYPGGTPEAGQLRYHRVLVYHPKVTDDVYVTTLVADLNAELDRRGVPRDSRSWDAQQELYGFPAPCETPGFDRHTLLFFAGRNDDFATFGNAVTRGCLATESPAILGADTVTRLIADPKAMAALPASLTVRYVAKGVPIILGGAECVRGNGVVGTEAPTLDFQELCNEMSRLVTDLAAYPDLASYHPSWPGDRTGLAYDVAGVILQAVRVNRARPERPREVNRAAIALQLRGTDYLGVTGTLYFSRGRVADDSTIGILVATGLGRSDQPRQCLLMYPQGVINGRGPDGCPAGTKSDTEDWTPPER